VFNSAVVKYSYLLTYLLTYLPWCKTDFTRLHLVSLFLTINSVKYPCDVIHDSVTIICTSLIIIILIIIFRVAQTLYDYGFTARYRILIINGTELLMLLIRI